MHGGRQALLSLPARGLWRFASWSAQLDVQLQVVNGDALADAKFDVRIKRREAATGSVVEDPSVEGRVHRDAMASGGAALSAAVAVSDSSGAGAAGPASENRCCLAGVSTFRVVSVLWDSVVFAKVLV